MSKKVKKTTRFNKNVQIKEYTEDTMTEVYQEEIIQNPEIKRKLTTEEIENCLSFIIPFGGIPKDIAESISEKNKKSLRKQLLQVEIYPSLLPKLQNEMRTYYYKTLIQPGESVGVATAQSIGERQTQSTLNSVDWTTKVIVKEGSKIIIDCVGNLIDNMINEIKNEVQMLENDQQYLNIEKLDFEIPTTDENGKTSWEKIEAVTRHPGEVIKVNTKSGRSVIASLGKSFLVMKNNKLTPIDGKDLKVGDNIPITIQFPSSNIVLDKLDIGLYISKKDYIFGSELYKAVNYKNSGEKHWWLNNQDINFSVPFKRGDTAIDCFKKGKIINNMIYPITGNRKMRLPELIDLDSDFGFFIGAYLAEGCCSKTQVIISNNDEGYINRIKIFCDKYNLGYHIQIQNDKNFKGATSTDIRVHSTILVSLMTCLCGNGSQNKKIPPFTVLANDTFNKEILNGYFSGDGSINFKRYYIYCSSASEDLIDGINLILNKFGIFTIKRFQQLQKNNLQTKNILPTFLLFITCGNIKIFQHNIHLQIEKKQANLDKLVSLSSIYKYSKFDIFDVTIDNQVQRIHRDKLYLLPDKHQDIITNHFQSNVLWDEVTSIQSVEKTGHYLYDFTVAKTRNFNLFNGLVQRDTFHTAGSAIKTVITGVPRFSELLNATKEPKARSTQIFFNECNDSITSLRHLVGNKIRELKLKDLITGYSIHSNKEREGWYDIFDQVYGQNYQDFSECISYTFNKDILYEYKISLRTVANVLESKVKDIICVISPNHICKMDVYVDMSEINPVDDMSQEQAYDYHLRQHSVPHLNEISIYGITGVENIFFEKKDDEWMLDTEGSNFKEILGLPFVDKVKTISNDMWEIYDTLGIEAARNFLVEEFCSVVSSDGTFVNQSHILLLVDSMTFHGTITAISRYGHKKENCGPMAKASFEESLENFLKAGINGEKETTNGVSASIMLGKVPKVGTGLCDVLVDIKGLPGCVPVLGDVKER